MLYGVRETQKKRLQFKLGQEQIGVQQLCLTRLNHYHFPMMKTLILLFIFLFSFSSISAVFKVQPGKLHKKGKVVVNILPDKEKYMVEMEYSVKKKDLVPVPQKLLEGTKVMEFPQKFRTVAGYKELEKKKHMDIPKADLNFIKRADIGDLKDAYFFEVKPTNKKSKIDIVYHPSLPATGWLQVDITFLSNLPVLDGYVVKARLNR